MTQTSISYHDIHLVNPYTRSPLSYKDSQTLIDEQGNDFSIVNQIPRFVDSKNYAESFGFQWNIFKKTQIDKYNGTQLSEKRFYKSTGWNKAELKGQKVLEAGCGAGRFTQIVLDAGAVVYSFDYSNSVDANLTNNSPHPNLHLYQADIYHLPFPYNYFDKIFCFGVLQYTPNPRQAFFSLLPYLKESGEIAFDVYAKTWKWIFNSRYWYRPITKRLPHKTLLNIIQWYMPKWFPISTLLLKIPKIGYHLSNIIPNANYTYLFPFFSREALLEWAIMDTFDVLAPRFEHPQRFKNVHAWIVDSGLSIKYCGLGHNGYVAVGQKSVLLN